VYCWLVAHKPNEQGAALSLVSEVDRHDHKHFFQIVGFKFRNSSRKLAEQYGTQT
jgi:hypothetical protein